VVPAVVVAPHRAALAIGMAVHLVAVAAEACLADTVTRNRQERTSTKEGNFFHKRRHFSLPIRQSKQGECRSFARIQER
jgi:hypothetical protein